MQKKDKLVIGQPYEIIVRNEGRIIKVSGNHLTEDDVKEFIASGFINEDDVAKEVKKEEVFPEFEVIEKKINDTFPDFASFCNRVYEHYPSVLFQMMLKEYSNISKKGHIIKHGDIVYLINLADFSIMPYKISGVLGELEDISVFMSKEDASKALTKLLWGFSKYESKN